MSQKRSYFDVTQDAGIGDLVQVIGVLVAAFVFTFSLVQDWARKQAEQKAILKVLLNKLERIHSENNTTSLGGIDLTSYCNVLIRDLNEPVLTLPNFRVLSIGASNFEQKLDFSLKEPDMRDLLVSLYFIDEKIDTINYLSRMVSEAHIHGVKFTGEFKSAVRSNLLRITTDLKIEVDASKKMINRILPIID